MTKALDAVRVLVFDVFGTVVDWRGSITREMQALADARALDIDAAAFADAWRAGYKPAMDRVRNGELPWMNIDRLHRIILDQILQRFDVNGLSETETAQLNRAWHRLDPWADSVTGLQRLKTRYTLATLSNGNVALLTNMAKRAGLPWDCVLSAELFHHYKPDPEAYLGAAAMLDVHPEETMLVAAHEDDLAAARAVGLRSAFVRRPSELGKPDSYKLPLRSDYDVVANDFIDLAKQLGI
ncbi:MAG: haloacid dehalogenase type II [Betaproteobacteria bacterium]